jgi:hypothetical protein
MPSLRRSAKARREKHKPETVTGNFELHYEDVVKENRFAVIALFATGLVLLAVFVPKAVYHSVAGSDQVSVEAENGQVVNPELVIQVSGDISASEEGYIEFRLPPAGY